MSDPKEPQRRCGFCNGPLEADPRYCRACGRPVAPSRRPAPVRVILTRRRIAATAVVTLALGVMAILLTGPFGGSAPASGPPFDDGPEPVRAYLLSEGAPLIKFHTVTADASVIDVRDADACNSRLSEIATRFGDTPERLVVLAAATPDETTAHLLVNDIAAKRDLLAACAAGRAEVAGEFQSEVERSHQQASARLGAADVEVSR